MIQIPLSWFYSKATTTANPTNKLISAFHVEPAIAKDVVTVAAGGVTLGDFETVLLAADAEDVVSVDADADADAVPV